MLLPPLIVALVLIVVTSGGALGVCPAPHDVPHVDTTEARVRAGTTLTFSTVDIDVTAVYAAGQTPIVNSTSTVIARASAAGPSVASGLAGRPNPLGFSGRYADGLRLLASDSSNVFLVGASTDNVSVKVSIFVTNVEAYAIDEDEWIDVYLPASFFVNSSGSDAAPLCTAPILVGTVAVRTAYDATPFASFVAASTGIAMAVAGVCGLRHPGKAVDAQTLAAFGAMTCAGPRERALLGGASGGTEQLLRLLAPFALDETVGGALAGNAIALAGVWLLWAAVTAVTHRLHSAPSLEVSGARTFFPSWPFLLTLALYQGTAFLAMRTLCRGVSAGDGGAIAGGAAGVLVLLVGLPAATYWFAATGRIPGEFVAYDRTNVGLVWQLLLPAGRWDSPEVVRGSGGIMQELQRPERASVLIVFAAPALTAVIAGFEPSTDNGCFAQYIVLLIVHMAASLVHVALSPLRTAVDTILAVAAHVLLVVCAAAIGAGASRGVQARALDVPAGLLMAVTLLRVVNDGFVVFIERTSGFKIVKRLFYWHDGTRASAAPAGGEKTGAVAAVAAAADDDDDPFADDTVRPVANPMLAMPSMVRESSVVRPPGQKGIDDIFASLEKKKSSMRVTSPGAKPAAPPGRSPDPFDDPFADGDSLTAAGAASGRKKGKSDDPFADDDDPFADDDAFVSPQTTGSFGRADSKRRVSFARSSSTLSTKSGAAAAAAAAAPAAATAATATLDEADPFDDPFADDDDPFADSPPKKKGSSPALARSQSARSQASSAPPPPDDDPFADDADPFADAGDDVPVAKPPTAASRLKSISQRLMLGAKLQSTARRATESREQREMFGDAGDVDQLRATTSQFIKPAAEAAAAAAAAEAKPPVDDSAPRANPMQKLGGGGAMAAAAAAAPTAKPAGGPRGRPVDESADLLGGLIARPRVAPGPQDDEDGGGLQQDGVVVFRIENEQLARQPAVEFGTFFDGDSYVVVRTADNLRDRELFIWIGKSSTADELKAVVERAVELDSTFECGWHRTTASGGFPITRMVQGRETMEFLALFPGNAIQVLEGGVDSSGAVQTRLFHVHGTNMRNTTMTAVPPTWESLDEDDVFVLDTGAIVFVFQGSECSPMERMAGGRFATDMALQRAASKVEVVTSDDAPDLFWQRLGTTRAKIRGKELKRAESFHASTANRAWIVKGANDFELVASGRDVSPSALRHDKVMIVDCCHIVFVWVGKDVPGYVAARATALPRAVQYLKKHSSTDVPLMRVVDEHEGTAFQEIFL